MGISLDLKQFGLESLDLENFFETEKNVDNVPKNDSKKEKKPEDLEAECLYEKKYVCPVCERSFQEKTVRKNKIHLISQDIDLHLRNEPLDTNKYEIVVCNNCGYARIDRYFNSIGTASIKKVKEKISYKYKPIRTKGNIYTYDDALKRYNLAIANAYAIGLKSSEKAMLCLKTAWIIREIKERTDKESDKFNELFNQEKSYLKLALEGFKIARSKELPPICNLDNVSFEYLLAALMFENEEYSNAYKILYNIITAKSTGRIQKNKANILIDEIRKKKTSDE